tara:strand:+ start:220 stop:384 length:165 start_codon:yes stop_codon:yes gene_type:complete
MRYRDAKAQERLESYLAKAKQYPREEKEEPKGNSFISCWEGFKNEIIKNRILKP